MSDIDYQAVLADLEARRETFNRSIDAAIVGVRLLLGQPAPIHSATGTPILKHGERLAACERCDKTFTVANGSAGRFCSRECYSPGDMDINERRTRILNIVRTRGPVYPSMLVNYDATLRAVSSGTRSNDLYYLSREGLIHNTNDGWMAKPEQASAAVEGSEATSQDTSVPFSQEDSQASH